VTLTSSVQWRSSRSIHAHLRHQRGRVLLREAHAGVAVGQLQQLTQVVVFLMKDVDFPLQTHYQSLPRVLQEKIRKRKGSHVLSLLSSLVYPRNSPSLTSPLLICGRLTTSSTAKGLENMVFL
jgi:hypothetical protein